MAQRNSIDRRKRLQQSTRIPLYIPKPSPDPKGAHRKLQGGRAGYRTARHQLIIGELVENGGKGGSWGERLIAAGYSPNTAKTPAKVTGSAGFLELLEEALPDEQLTQVHQSLLLSKRLDHMTFPLGPQGEDDENFSGAHPALNPIEQAGVHVERTTLTDYEIKDLVASIGGTVRRIVHGETARHVYFWAPNDNARQAALKLAYDLKGYTGKKEPDPGQAGNTYNTFIQQNHIDPNTPDAKQLVDNTLDLLMQATKAPQLPNA